MNNRQRIISAMFIANDTGLYWMPRTSSPASDESTPEHAVPFEDDLDSRTTVLALHAPWSAQTGTSPDSTEPET